MILFIFDIDGTLSDLEHRRTWVKTDPKNWDAFHIGVINDKPHNDIIFLCNLLYTYTNLSKGKLFLVSGRTDAVRAETEEWLKRQDVHYDELHMRKSGDHRDDRIIKKEILDSIRERGLEPTMVFDDRDRVCQMWRENGIRCLQVAPGDF